MVGTYTISVSPDDGTGVVTTMSVSIDDEGTRITELTVRAANGVGLRPQELPSIDLELLLRAIGLASARAAVAPAETTPSRPRKRAGGRGRRAERQQPAARPRRRGGRAGAKAEASTLGGRAYRRMPDDLAEVYDALQSVTQVAQHYDVPRHTAQGWMNRLRRETQ